MKVACVYSLIGIVVSVLAGTMFGPHRRGTKRKANGEARGSRQQLLRKLRPEMLVDARARKSLANLLALGGQSSDWVEHVREGVFADASCFYLCTKCGSTGAHVLSEDMRCGLYYRCLGCGGKGAAVRESISGSSLGGGDCDVAILHLETAYGRGEGWCHGMVSGGHDGMFMPDIGVSGSGCRGHKCASGTCNEGREGGGGGGSGQNDLEDDEDS